MARTLLRNPPRTGKLAYGYVRVSKGEKVQQSIPAQEAIVRKAAAAEGYTLVRIYKDEKSRGVRRDGLHAMLTDVDADPEVGAVIFWDYRRLWGHHQQYLRLNERAFRAGYRLLDSKGTDHVSETAVEKFLALVRSGVSELETETVGERVKETNTAKVETYGQLVSRPPLGVCVRKFFDGNGQPRTEPHVDSHDMDIVRRIMGMYEANTPTYKIAETLLAENVQTTAGKRTWSVAGLRAIIDNRFYVGELHYNQSGTHWEMDEVTGDKIKRRRARPAHEHVTGKSPLGVVLAEDPSDPQSVKAAIRLFENCQVIRNRKGRERPKRIYEHGVLDGLVYCARCGKRMHRTRASFKSRVTGERLMNFNYQCPYRSNIGTGCSRSHSMSEKRVFAELQKLVDTRGLTAEGESTWRPAPRDERAARAAIESAEREVANAHRAMERAREAFEADVYSIEEFRERKVTITERQRKAALDLSGAVAQARPQQDVRVEMTGVDSVAFTQVVTLLTNDRIPLDARRDAASRFFDRIAVDNPCITVVIRTPRT